MCVKFCLNGIKAKLSKFLFDVTPSITTAEPNLIFNIFSLVRNNVGSAVVIEGVTSNRNLDNLAFV
jgi:hypothetical protein